MKRKGNKQWEPIKTFFVPTKGEYQYFIFSEVNASFTQVFPLKTWVLEESFAEDTVSCEKEAVLD